MFEPRNHALTLLLRHRPRNGKSWNSRQRAAKLGVASDDPVVQPKVVNQQRFEQPSHGFLLSSSYAYFALIRGTVKIWVNRPLPARRLCPENSRFCLSGDWFR
jgi:hypothetical protein